jgi:hypothetical protein
LFIISAMIQRTIINSRITHSLYRKIFFSAATAKPQKTLYQVLEVPSSAPQNNIRKNYLKLAKIFHPDVYKGSDKGRF